MSRVPRIGKVPCWPRKWSLMHSLEDVRKPALEKLGEILNFLTYATNRKFALRTLKRVIDWTPGVVDRNAAIFVETPEFDEAEPALGIDFIDTAQRLLAMQGGDAQRAAMRWYRRGITDRSA